MVELKNQVNCTFHFISDPTDVDSDVYLVVSSLQCRIIRTTELAAAQEKLQELERMKEDTLKYHSPTSLVHRLQGTITNFSCFCNLSFNIRFVFEPFVSSIS